MFVCFVLFFVAWNSIGVLPLTLGLFLEVELLPALSVFSLWGNDHYRKWAVPRREAALLFTFIQGLMSLEQHSWLQYTTPHHSLLSGLEGPLGSLAPCVLEYDDQWFRLALTRFDIVLKT